MGSCLLPILCLFLGLSADGHSQTLRSEPQDPAVLVQQTERLVQVGRCTEALPLYQQLLRIDPDHTQYHRKFQNCLTYLDRKGQALKTYRQRLRLHPEEARNWYLLGRLVDDSKKRRRCFEKAIKVDPQYPWGYYGLGVYWGGKEHYLKGGRLLRRALELGIDEPLVHYFLGVYCQELGWKRQALTAYRRFLRLQPYGQERSLIINRMKLLKGNYSALFSYVLLALLPAGFWLGYMRRWSLLCTPSWHKLIALVAGGAVFSAFLLTDWLYRLVGPFMEEFTGLHPLPYRVLKHFLFVGPVEEFSKWIVVLAFAYRCKLIKGRLDGMVCAAAVAIGFALEENINYMWVEGWSCIVERGLVCVPMHIAASAVWGCGLGQAQLVADPWRRRLLMALSLGLGATLHGFYNAAIAFRQWEQASGLVLCAGWLVPLVLALLFRGTRRQLKQAQLWSPLFRKSLALKRLVARRLDAECLHQVLALRPGTGKARQHWSAAVNLVTREVLEQLHGQLRREQVPPLHGLLDRSDTSSRDVLRFWRERTDVQSVVDHACQTWEEKLEKRSSGRWKRSGKKLRRKIGQEVKLEKMRSGPVRFFKDYPAMVGARGKNREFRL